MILRQRGRMTKQKKNRTSGVRGDAMAMQS
jgi:hypothetical protein